jgi:matrixin
MKMTTAGVLLFVVSVIPSAAHGQFGVAWRHTPTLAVITNVADDPRLSLVDEAVSFWNRTLEEVGSGFRLGPVERLMQPVPEYDLQALSRSILSGSRPVDVPTGLRNPPRDLTIMLGNSDFVSFAGPFDSTSKRVVGIRGLHLPPMHQSNVARNVIAHELGHAIGLGHNDDRTKLMCGRPASCRPDVFRSDEPRLFPLTDDEKRQLLKMYPAGWTPR